MGISALTMFVRNIPISHRIIVSDTIMFVFFLILPDEIKFHSIASPITTFYTFLHLWLDFSLEFYYVVLMLICFNFKEKANHDTSSKG
jgi:hypothetical protein